MRCLAQFQHQWHCCFGEEFFLCWKACCFRENYFQSRHIFKACCFSSEAALWPAPLITSSLRSPPAFTVALLLERAELLNVCHHMTLKQTVFDTQHLHSHPCNLKTKQYYSNISDCSVKVAINQTKSVCYCRGFNLT